ncbi:hypothetical protein FB566_0884 [Stackebrandtia endophytica]|uniref:Uncharacterized protein n=1 Tax=Stackebrandtia endophytica TaxID=1496996 RepID=A0A543AS23_9ACTN|nr:hypothetical protein [Stackebrandtia endophytica]TQL75383.1 hypothetical protein FB566_0884 [Stackebrandtia endophytica]
MVDPGTRETLEQADGRIRERRAILAPALATTDDHSLAAVAICMAAHTQGDAVSRAHGVLQQVGGLEGVSVTNIAALITAAQVDAFITEAESAIYRRPEANLILWTIVATHAAGAQLTSLVLLTAYAAECSIDIDLCHQALSLVKPSQLTPAAFELLDLMYGRH